MVKKLFKHEYLAWLRIMPIIFGITLAVAGLLRLAVAFETDSMYYDLVLGSGIFMFVVAIIATLVAPTIFAIVRFYKNMFSGEGYLTHTLPVTPANHLWAKALTAVTFDVAAVLVVILSVMIATAGDVLTEIWKAGAYLLHKIPEKYVGHLAGWVAEYGLLLLVAMFTSHFMYYFCICVGQLTRKNRKLAAVGMYFGLYAITQVISTVLTVVFAYWGETGVLDKPLEWVGKHPEASIHIFLLVFIVVMALLSVVSGVRRTAL